ncbi:hypothetical protein [Catenulispora rubra]|uniref:hypothetical protein n=1 Tax=Catenulispora rubra TaxID=280293 RepID=UPI0018922049|nr:hypothetical protein [Catenulispora rubra]
MAKQYRIRITGKQRETIDIDLMTQLVIMLGRQLAAEAAEEEDLQKRYDRSVKAAEAARAETAE